MDPVLGRSGRRRIILAASLAVFIPFAPSRGEEWPILGARAMGMGGAGVAASRGGSATYWNPAALARSTLAPRALPAEPVEGFRWNGLGGLNLVLAAPNGTLEDMGQLREDVEDLDISGLEQKLSSGTPLSGEELGLALKIVSEDIPALDEDGEGVLIQSASGLTFQLERFGLAALFTFHGGASPSVDLVYVGLGDQGLDPVVGAGQDRSGALSVDGQSLADQLAASDSVTQNQAEELVFQAEQAGVDTSDPTARAGIQASVDATTGESEGGSITDNESGATVRGVFLQELALGYGHPIGDWLALGVTAKAMHAFTYSSTYVLRNLPRTGEVIEDIFDVENEEGDVNFGVDAGVLLTPFEWLALGVTGRNLNRPAFDSPESGHFVLDPAARAGVAIYPLGWITLAADVDLFHNHSDVLPGYRSQVLGGGAQVDLGMVALRAGISKNLLAPSEDFLLHAGLALRLGPFSVEGAVMATPELRTVDGDGTEIPQRAGASLNLGFNVAF